MRQLHLHSRLPKPFLTLILLSLWLQTPRNSCFAADVNLPDLIEAVEPSVVRIEVELFRGKSQGSGFLSDKGVVTNFHVIRHAVSAKVIFSDRSEAKVRGVRAWDEDRDLAILAIDDQSSRPKLTIKADLPRKGELVVAFGAPRGFSFTTSDGIVSAIRTGSEIRQELDEYDQPDDLQWIQTTAPISAGNSGGPLVNGAREVVGINTWTLRQGQNLNFALSSIEVLKLLAKTLKLKMLSRFQQDNSLEFLADLSVAGALLHAVNGVVPQLLAEQ